MIDNFDLEKFEKLLTELSGGSSKVGTHEGRMAVAACFGYVDARFMVFLKETYGFPLSLSAAKAAEHGLKVDYSGLKYELEKIGKNKETVESELKEVRYFADNVVVERQK